MHRIKTNNENKYKKNAHEKYKKWVIVICHPLYFLTYRPSDKTT